MVKFDRLKNLFKKIYGDKLPKLKVENIPLKYITVNPYQPRRDYDENELNELVNSIKSHGIIQPIVLKKIKRDEYEIVCGERRYRAAKLAGLSTIPAIISNYDEVEQVEVALIENIHRKDLTPLEEAQAFSLLRKIIKAEGKLEGLSESDIEYMSRVIGYDVNKIEERIILLSLSEILKEALNANWINEEQAKLLNELKDEDMQLALIDRIKKEKLNVDAVRELINSISEQEKLTEDEKEKQRTMNLSVVLLENLIDALKVCGLNIDYQKEKKDGHVELKIKIE